MLKNRLKQFREYNKADISLLANILKISEDEYKGFESGKNEPDIEVIKTLSCFYKVTVDEFYGYTPRVTFNSEKPEFDDTVPETILKLSDLSWDEAQLIYYYRKTKNKEVLIKQIIDEEYKSE